MSTFELDTFTPYRLALLASQVSASFAAIYTEKFGLTVAQWRVMAHLSAEDAVSVRDIHTRVNMDKSKVSRAAMRLELRGLIAKEINPRDRRLVVLSLTPAGRRMMDEIAPLACAFDASLKARMSPAQVEALDTLLKALATPPELA